MTRHVHNQPGKSVQVDQTPNGRAGDFSKCHDEAWAHSTEQIRAGRGIAGGEGRRWLAAVCDAVDVGAVGNGDGLSLSPALASTNACDEQRWRPDVSGVNATAIK
nr:hypothetical protein Iba_scaffold31105CG0070 [Ipomoea batatas]